jgi:hypothetical protein
MKRKITKQQLIEYIKRLDTRCKKYDDEKFDEIIDDSFSELNIFGGFFFDEDTLEIEQYMNDGVKKLSYDVERDVTYVYDAFLSVDSKTPYSESDKHVEVDPRVLGRINIDFTSTKDMYNAYTYHEQDNAATPPNPNVLIVKYYYIPTSEFTEIYMNRDVYKALRQAIAASTYLDLHDDKRNEIHYKKMELFAKSIVFETPNDFYDKPNLERFINGC